MPPRLLTVEPTGGLCLAQTRKIAGAYFSSFSEAASVLGDVDLVVIGGPK